MAGKCDYRKYFLSDPTSQCIDGTRAVYYHRSGYGTGQTKWHIHFEGGGWCYDLESCHYRSTTNLGSSKAYEECLSLSFIHSAYFSTNETENPLLYNSHVIYVRYCDGSSFAGNERQRYQGHTLLFNGKKIRQNLLTDLWQLRGMKKATDVIFSGASAGGLAVYLGIDDLQNYLQRKSQKKIRIAGMPDSGFFPNYDSAYLSKGMKEMTLRPGGPRYQYLNGMWFADEYDPVSQRNIYGSKMKQVFNFTGIGKPLEEPNDFPLSPLSRCQSLLSDPRECIFPQNLLPHISAPLFILQPLYDSWMITHILGVPLGQEDDTMAVNKFGRMVKDSLVHSLPSSSPHGIYFDSCHHHTFASSTGASFYLQISDSNHVTIPEAFMTWYQTISSTVHIQEAVFPCSHCCGAQKHSPQYIDPSPSVSSSFLHSPPFGWTVFSLLLSAVLVLIVRLSRRHRN